MQSEFTAALGCGRPEGVKKKRTKPMQRAASARSPTLTRNRELTSKKYLSESIEQKNRFETGAERFYVEKRLPPLILLGLDAQFGHNGEAARLIANKGKLRTVRLQSIVSPKDRVAGSVP